MSNDTSQSEAPSGRQAAIEAAAETLHAVLGDWLDGSPDGAVETCENEILTALFDGPGSPGVLTSFHEAEMESLRAEHERVVEELRAAIVTAPDATYMRNLLPLEYRLVIARNLLTAEELHALAAPAGSGTPAEERTT